MYVFYKQYENTSTEMSTYFQQRIKETDIFEYTM